MKSLAKKAGPELNGVAEDLQFGRPWDGAHAKFATFQFGVKSYLLLLTVKAVEAILK